MNLVKKIEEKSAKVAVVGLGYVGLPMAVSVARKGFSVLGIDVSDHAVNSVNEGKNYIGDVDDAELEKYVKEGKLKATKDYGKVNDIDVIMIAVPTPLDKYHQPDSSFVKAAADSIVANISEETLIVLESTTYPGTTEEIIVPALQEKGFIVGENVYVSFSPERVDPGNKVYKTSNTPKVVGGVTANCNNVSEVFYKSILDAEVHLVSSPAVAEMEKIYENTFRNINIALANEMTILCEKMGIDIWEVIEAAKTKPYGFMAFYPGPGVGGHCIPIDPFYLTWKAREYNYHTRLIELAGEINIAMPEFVVNKAGKILNQKGIALSKSNILLLGAAYKKDIEDMRESPIMQVIIELEKEKASFDINDPHVEEFHNEINDKVYKTVGLENIEKYDLVILITDHSSYDMPDIVKRSRLILDTRMATKGITAENIIKL
ncbi:MAG: UDP-N-acetyl-D-glucosamine dehydrogenase [Candidatus Cloacimonadota bacterium]|nr:MAG: UDP-N-acetyl-D-glucosamine dehydrogenase [Candidatus Cloacimonadota bacterium]